MRNCRRHWFLILGVIVLLVSPLVACGKPGFITYTNDKGGYSISYPYNWQLEVTDDGTICVLKSPGRRASVRIDVINFMPAEEAAKRWLMAMGTAWEEITLLENKPMKGSWDWYLSYDYEADFGMFHGEAYFKETEKHLYKVDTAGDVTGYSDYPFAAIISSFKPR